MPKECPRYIVCVPEKGKIFESDDRAEAINFYKKFGLDEDITITLGTEQFTGGDVPAVYIFDTEFGDIIAEIRMVSDPFRELFGKCGDSIFEAILNDDGAALALVTEFDKRIADRKRH